MHLLRDLWATSRIRTGLAALLIVVDAGGQVLAAALAGPLLVQKSWTLFLVLALGLLIAVTSDVAIGLLVARLTADWSAGVRRRLCRVALGQDLPRLETTPVGELLDRIDSDVYQVASEVRGSVVRLLQATAMGLLSIATALFVWWPAGLGMALLTSGLVLGLSSRAREISTARMQEEEAWSDLAAVMEEAIHGQDDVRTSLARPYVLRQYAQRSREVLARGRIVWGKSAWVTTVATGVTRFGIAVVVLAGAWGLATQRIGVARLTTVWLLALAFGATVEHVSRMIPELQNALGAWARVVQLEGAEQEPLGGEEPATGDLALTGLTFWYGEPGHEAGRRPALRDVWLTFVPGRSYALIGRSGSGKSTIAKVLTRAVNVPRGTVSMAGVDVLDLDLERLRRRIAVVPQRTEILAGTVAENVALFDPELLGRAAEALEELGLTEWVESLPDGLQTRLGDGGHVLSAGQEQLVAFARILVRDPRVVILDEATARLDPVTEVQVQRATERLVRGRIGLIIAHRLSSVRRCDEVVVLADGEVIESGPLGESEKFAELFAAGQGDAASAPGVEDRTSPSGMSSANGSSPTLTLTARSMGVLTQAAIVTLAPAKTDPPPQPPAPRASALREVLRLATNDPRFGLGAVGMFCVMSLLGLDGSILPWLWARLVDGNGSVLWPAAAISLGLVVILPFRHAAANWLPEWWVRQMLRISLRLVHGQTGSRRVSDFTPAEVVAQGGDTERVVFLADNLMDQFMSILVMITMTLVAGSFVPAGFFLATMVLSACSALVVGPLLSRSARRTVAARAAFATALVSSLSAARTVKLAGATEAVLVHLARLDAVRSDRQRREISVQVWARSTPSLVSGLLPIGAWALFLRGDLSTAATLVAVSTLGAARWFAWTTSSLISQLPSARVWTTRTAAMTGVSAYSAGVPGVDISAGTAPGPTPAPRHPLDRLDLRGFSAVHEDGTIGVHDIDVAVERGQLVLVVGPVGSGKSSLLRAMAGIVHHTGDLLWNGEDVSEPEIFLRPNQVGYVAQLPRVLSGSIADNIRLGHEVDASYAVDTAQLGRDLALAEGGLALMIGHKGTRLSGGQLQRLALARALAPNTEVLLADDVSSALDITTELALWRALRDRGVTVVGSTSKRAALAQADRVMVLMDGGCVAQGTWAELSEEWGHLAG